MEHDMTLEQLRSAGVIAAVTMSRAAFPNRLEHMKVLERFAPIWQLFWSKRSGATQKVQSKKLLDHENVETLLSAALKPLEVEVDDTAQPAYAVGKTRTYFVAGALEYLEALRFKGLEICATAIESLARGIVVRKTLNHNYFVARIRSRQRIQMWWRCMQAKTAFLILLREEQEKKNRLRLQCWFRKILALKVAAHLRGDVEKKRRQKGIKKRTANKRTAAAARIQAVVRGKNQRAKYTSERGIIYKYHGLEDEVDRLEQELLEMEAAFKEGERDHAKELKELEEERLKQSHGYHEERFDESFASLGSSIASFNSPNSGRRKSMSESDEVAQQRKANKKLRKQIHTLEQEQKALGQNAKALSKSNDDARNAIVDAKNVYLKLMVRNNRNQSEAEGLWEDLHSKARRKNARLNQLEVEKQTRSRYLKTVKKAVKLVKKRIPDTRLATDVDRVVSMYISTESCRLGKVHGVSRQDSTRSLSSITSDTEHSDSESESPDNGSALS
jgi:myosin heavy subunit